MLYGYTHTHTHTHICIYIYNIYLYIYVCVYIIYMPFSFTFSENLVLKQIRHSGQWKLIFWLVETILFQYIKYTFHWKQLFHHVGIYPLLQPVATDFLFTGSDILSFRFFLKPKLQLDRRQYFFLKQISFLLEETVFFNFFSDTD